MITDTNINTPTEIVKPIPIYIQTEIIDPLIQLLQQVRKNDFTLKQLKENQAKIQLKSSENYSLLVNALKNKKANFRTCQLKTDRSYKANQTNKSIKEL